MLESSNESTHTLATLRRKLQRLRVAIYSQSDPSANPQLRAELMHAQTALRDRERTAATVAEAAPSPLQATPTGRLLGPETTGLKVEPTLNMNPVPTSIYPLLDPDTDPLLTVAL